MNPRETLRHAFSAGLATLAVTTACDRESKTPLNDISPTVTASRDVPTVQSGELAIREVPAGILEYFYPELLESGLKPKSVIAVDAHISRIPTVVFNYTELNLDRDYMSQVYSIFESMAALNEDKIDYPVDGFRKQFVLQPHALDVRLHLVLPQDAPDPITTAGNFSSREALTAFTPDAPIAFSILQYPQEGVGIFNTQDELLAANFAIETCNQVVLPAVVDEAGNVGTLEEEVFAKEVICNSFGVGVTAALLGKNFEEYQAFIRARSLSFGPDGSPSQGRFPYLPLDEASYSSIVPGGGTLVR